MAAVMLSQVNDLSCVDAAHWYLEQGLRPIPWVVGDEGGKRAAISGFTYQAYTVTHGDIDRWSAGWQVGLALGDHGSRVYAIDVDSYVELHEWQNQHGAGVGLGPSWRQTSGRGDGGEHRLYRAGALWPRHGKFSGEYTHLEVISNGLLAVSPSVHPSGRRYRWTTDATPEIREAGPLLAQYLGEREVARATNGSKSYPSGGSGGSNQGGDSGRPDIGALLRDGIQSEQDVTLRDVVWFGVMDGKSFEEIHLLWQAIVFKTPLTKPSPWNATYVPPGQRPPGHEVSDFERHYDSAVGKLRDHEPIVVEEWMWTAIQHLRQTSTEVSVSEAGVPSVSPPVENDPQPGPSPVDSGGEIIPPDAEKRIRKEQLRLRALDEARLREQKRKEDLRLPVKLVGMDEFLQRPVVTYLVDDVIQDDSIFLMFGQSGEHKTFLVVDLCMSTAAGVPWHGHAVNGAGPIAFFLGEGQGGFGNRLRAWTSTVHGEVEGVFVLDQGLPNLYDETDVTQIITELKSASDRWSIVCFDALSDFAVGGSDNDASEISKVIRALRRIKSEANVAAVGVIDHTGWDETRERGSSRKRQAFDTVIQVAGGMATCVKQRDGEQFNPVIFHVEPAEGSLVVRPGVDLAQQANLVTAREQMIIEIVAENDRGMTANAVSLEAEARSDGRQGFSARGFRNLIRDLIAQGRIFEVPAGRGIHLSMHAA
jgi:hypothetical protein